MTTTPKWMVFSYGMGVDSTAILLRYLAEPHTCPVPLDHVILLTAQVGNEFPTTGELVTEHILPRLREAGVRFVQVGKAGPSGAAAEVLEDSTSPAECHLAGAYPIAAEMKGAATIPTTGGCRKCSLKFKGAVLDHWVARELGDEPYLHVIGFNADELRRVEKDQVFGKAGSRVACYPLVEWGWDRAKCHDYITEQTGVRWLKSACSFCPFSQGKGTVVDRYLAEPEAAAEALVIEEVALRFNPRMKLFKSRTLRGVLEASGNTEALALADSMLDAVPWAVFRMRRAMMPAKANPAKRGFGMRAIERTTDTMTRAEAEATLGGARQVVLDTGEGFPRREESLVAAPAWVQEKAGRYGIERFTELWNDAAAAQGEPQVATTAETTQAPTQAEAEAPAARRAGVVLPKDERDALGEAARVALAAAGPLTAAEVHAAITRQAPAELKTWAAQDHGWQYTRVFDSLRRLAKAGDLTATKTGRTTRYGVAV